MNPKSPAAVSSGNVETSQRIVDVLLLALHEALPDRIPAQSQGTMNNIAIGGQTDNSRAKFTYYETIAGGAVWAHYRFWWGGRFRGGLGIRRAIKVLITNATLSLQSERRKYQPKGLCGGGNGRAGKNYLIRSKKRLNLPSKVTMPLEEGDIVVIETPGGGGYGVSQS